MNKEKKYCPAPLELGNVKLPESLAPLTERIAENIHEVWAKSRMDEGWTYGNERNDRKKTHPCLIPYSELPEIEKEYDRNTALSALKMVVKLGYRIIPDEENPR